MKRRYRGLRFGSTLARRCAVVLALLSPGAIWAGQGSTLDRVERLTDDGEVREARQLLDTWSQREGGSAPVAERARGWYLAGRLADDGAAAELHYLKVVIEGSATRYADDALLKLAQYRFSRGEYARSVEYLGRLRRDYPTSEHAARALLWIARTAQSLGDTERACASAEQALREVSPADTVLERALLEVRRGCSSDDEGGSFSVQVAALKDAVAAQRLAQRLLADGYKAWLLNATPPDSLYRVRVGRDLSASDAEELMDRLVDAGYSPFLVSETAGYRGGGE